MDSDKAWYVFRYYSHLMNEQERAANRHFAAEVFFWMDKEVFPTLLSLQPLQIFGYEKPAYEH
jgi:hypothetical protein